MKPAFDLLRKGVRGWFVCAAIAAATAGCRLVPHERHSTGDPDARLAAALAQLDRARDDGMNNNTVIEDESVTVAPETARLRIEHLSLEFPHHVPTLTMCAMLAFEASEFEKAGSYADRVLALQPENNFAAIIRARVALQEGNLPRAKQILEREIRMTPESPFLHETLASVHYYSDDLDAAEKELRLAAAHGSDAARIAYLRGLIAEKRGSTADAKKLYSEAIRLQPDFEPAQSHLLGLDPSPAKKQK